MGVESEAAEKYARNVCSEILAIRGYAKSLVPAYVRNDVFNTMARHESEYCSGFSASVSPSTVASRIQTAEWELAYSAAAEYYPE